MFKTVLLIAAALAIVTVPASAGPSARTKQIVAKYRAAKQAADYRALLGTVRVTRKTDKTEPSSADLRAAQERQRQIEANLAKAAEAARAQNCAIIKATGGGSC